MLTEKMWVKEPLQVTWRVSRKDYFMNWESMKRFSKTFCFISCFFLNCYCRYYFLPGNEMFLLLEDHDNWGKWYSLLLNFWYCNLVFMPFTSSCLSSCWVSFLRLPYRSVESQGRFPVPGTFQAKWQECLPSQLICSTLGMLLNTLWATYES